MCVGVRDELQPRGLQLRYIGFVNTRGLVLGCIALSAGCGFQGTGRAAPDGTEIVDSSPDGSTPPRDAAIDARPDARPDARACFGAGIVEVCLDTLPTANLDLPNIAIAANINTDNDTICTRVLTQPSGPELCLLAAPRITVVSAVTAIGDRPLVLLGLESITVNAALDASSKVNPPRTGAGANTGTCAVAGRGSNDSGGGGGGAGGSFGTIGGPGGTGDTNDQPNDRAPGGNPGATQMPPTIVRGGCSGGAGGDSVNGGTTTGGPGGVGGGAVYLIAGSMIVINPSGDIFASGAGGSGDGLRDGGGGGGSGGMIVLDAPIINANGRVTANGGAGGSGGAGASGGNRGNDGATTDWNRRPAGGVGPTEATGRGGNGAEGTVSGGTDNLNGQSAQGGGGGGAGGLGMIWHYGTLQTTVGNPRISPAPVSR